MKILGLRCTPQEINFAVLNGSIQKPKLERFKSIKFPKGFGRGDSLNWLSQEIASILQSNNIDGVGIKSTEPTAMKGKPFGERSENEGVIILEASKAGIKYIKKKVNATISKDLGMKGKGKYLKTKLDTSIIPEFEGCTQNVQDAIMIAWSMLK